jgi:hypothetical protein
MDNDNDDDIDSPVALEREWDGPEPQNGIAFAACLSCRSLVIAVTPDDLPTSLLDPSPTIRLRFWSELSKSAAPFFAGLNFAAGRRGFHSCE